ncbi:MAG: TolB family protein [Chitinophagaceae bacterium]
MIFHFANAQQFGGNPSSVKWKQINTDTVRIIFPQGLDSMAERIAALTHFQQKYYASTIGDKIRKISIVLQKDVTYSNGEVELGPYRSEFFLMPSINAFELGAQSWADNLSIHEFRHVQQYSNFREGLSKTIYYLFGENGQAVANAASIPDWFFEGDAVYNETKLSEQGRGRLPFFFAGYRSLYDAEKNYSYIKLRNGSFKNYVPDHYQLGYLLVAYGREEYGEDFWRKVTSDAVRFKPLFYPLQNAVKKYGEIAYDEFVKNAFNFYQQQWNNDSAINNIQWFTSIQKNNVINYKYPYATEDSSLIVLKNSYKTISAFYKINATNSQKEIAVEDITNDDYFSYNNGKIIYSALQPDVRWGNREYSVIKLLDVNSGAEKTLSSHTKYFTPDISHNGKLIVATAIKPDQHCDVDILNSDGIKIKSLITNSNFIYTYPKFSADDQSIFVVVRNAHGEMDLQQINISDSSITRLLPFSNRIVGFPVVQGDTLLYSCSNNGYDEVWAYISGEGRNYRLANYSTGLYQAAFKNNQLIAAAFTADGYRLTSLKPYWQPVFEKDTLKNLYVTKPFNNYYNTTLLNVSTANFSISKYSKFFHPFNFHSWQPNYADPDFSFTLYGENVLSTLQTQLYYTYNRNEEYSKIGYSTVFGGFYVQPVLNVSETFQRNAQLNDTSFYWNEFTASAGLQLPLNLSGGKQYRNLFLSSTYNIDNVRWTGFAKQRLNNINFNYVESRLQYTAQIQKAVQQIYPHWAQSFLFQYRNIINKYSAHQFLASANFYLPGFLKTHSIVLSAAYQSRDTMNEYSFSNDFPFSRGYVKVDFPQMWKLGANYHFTLFYPDWGFGNIVYFQRIRANAFYDFTNAKSLRTGNQFQFRTVGVEIYFDTKWWNQQPVSFGVRYNRLLDYKLLSEQPNQWEIILPVNLFY